MEKVSFAFPGWRQGVSRCQIQTFGSFWSHAQLLETLLMCLGLSETAENTVHQTFLQRHRESPVGSGRDPHGTGFGSGSVAVSRRRGRGACRSKPLEDVWPDLKQRCVRG